MFSGRFLRVMKKKDGGNQKLVKYSRERMRDGGFEPSEEEIDDIEEEIHQSAPEKSRFFSLQPGRLVIGSRVKSKGSMREPSLRLEVNNLDWPEKPQFYHDTCRNIEKRFDKVTLEHVTIEHLFVEKNSIFTSRSMALVLKSMKVFDANNCPLLYYCKGALKWPFFKGHEPIEAGENALKQLVSTYKPPEPNKTDPRHKGVVHKQGHGVFHLALWHATGHGYCIEEKDTPVNGGVLSANIATACARKMGAIAEFYVDFSPVTQAVGALFQVIDPLSYERFHGIYHAMADRSVLHWLRTATCNCFMGMAILSWLCCKPHRDKHDVADGWAADLTFGAFEGGNLEVPQLGLQFLMEPGDVVYLRSTLLQHLVSEVTSGHRFGIIYFNQKSMIEYGLEEEQEVV